MTKILFSTIFMSVILLTSMAATATPAFAAPIWSASGPGAVTVTDPDQGEELAQFTYLNNPAGLRTVNTWTFETTAAATGPVTVYYDWKGFHAFSKSLHH